MNVLNDNSYIDVYLHYLNDHDKALLSEYGIDRIVFSLNPLFNYPSFIKCLEKEAIMLSVKDWLPPDIYLFHVEQIYVRLIEIFAENEANIHTYEFKGGYYYNDFILGFIAEYPKFIYDVRNLLVEFNDSSQVKKFLKLLISSKSISKIHFRDECTEKKDDDKNERIN
jgi:hypothetical protein